MNFKTMKAEYCECDIYNGKCESCIIGDRYMQMVRDTIINCQHFNYVRGEFILEEELKKELFGDEK